jgi:DNA polymerase-1
MAALKDFVTLDFETEPIRARPDYPPEPKGLAVLGDVHVKGMAEKSYITDKAKITEDLDFAFKAQYSLVFHNAPFDLAVAIEKLGLKMPTDPTRIHDTLVMLFLLDPYAETYSLKPSAEKILGMKPEERNELEDWLLENQPIPGIKISRSKKSEHYVGAYIAYGPPEMVSRYAIGDVVRTSKLAKKCYSELKKRKMLGAYEREQRLLPVIMSMEKHGVRVDRDALKSDQRLYTVARETLDQWLYKQLKTEINLDSNESLADALLEAGLADKAKFAATATGKLSTAKNSLNAAISNPQISAALRWRGSVGTCLQTFIEPWLQMSEKTGRIYARWNYTRREEGGARTGRLSSTPNLQNIPKTFKPLFSDRDNPSLPDRPFKELPDTPQMRRYILPDEGHVLIDRDFSSQELRVLAYFEDGPIAQAFMDNPDLDLHQKVADDVGVTRKEAKTLNFAILYGVGNGHLAELLGSSVDKAREIKNAYFKEYPSVRELIYDLSAQAKAGLPITTWGGRQYYCEPPKLLARKIPDEVPKERPTAHGLNGWGKVIKKEHSTMLDKRMQTYEYKLLNYLIQGSSADLTKQAMIDFYATIASFDVHILASVHDELLVSVPEKLVGTVMTNLKLVMSTPWLEQVPLTSTGKIGPNWMEMQSCE